MDKKLERELPHEKVFKNLVADLQIKDIPHTIAEHPRFKRMLRFPAPGDFQGHNLWLLKKQGFDSFALQAMSQENLISLLGSLLTGIPLDDFIPIPIDYTTDTRCSECGKMVILETNGIGMRTVLPCPCPPKGPIQFELNVPSGELVYTDDLRPYFDVEEDYNINCRFGIIQLSLAMAKIGCAHGFVGNSCPGVYKINDITFAVATVPTDEETNEPINPPGEDVGSICTDLWWYSFADAEEFKKRGGSDNDNISRLKVRPGVYAFSHNLDGGDRDYNTTFVYATITWVRESV